MKQQTGGIVAIALVWLALATALAAQQDRPGAIPPEKGATGRAFSGRVLDGLGRSVIGVKVKVTLGREVRETVLQTGQDGKYAGILPPGRDDAVLSFEKEGYGDLTIGGVSDDGPVVLSRKVDWAETEMLPYRDGDELERGVRELLASEEWQGDDGELLGFVFRNQGKFRPALRRLIRDDHVGAGVRDWLDLLDDAGDRDLFPEGRKYAPKKEVKEADLVDALKATARQRNFFSSAPEPMIEIDFLKFTEDLDHALVQCGINRVAMTGITWQFVFRKVGKQWELRSVKEVGRT